MKGSYSQLEAGLAATYSHEYAKVYRDGEEGAEDWLRRESAQWHLVQRVAQSFPQPISVLDLGCGTGRYFNAYTNARMIVGLDYSEGMLKQARAPVGGPNPNAVLVRGNLLTADFRAGSFDMAACIGVLGASCPFTADVLSRLKKFVKPGGKVVFTVMSEPKFHHTLKSGLAAAALPFLFGSLKNRVYMRLKLFHVSMPTVEKLTRKYFKTVELARWQSPGGNIETHVIASDY